MKKYIYMAAIALSAVTLTGCEDFLDSENITQSNTEQFPSSPDDAERQLTAVYSTLNKAVSAVTSNYFYISEVACDDRLGGGGENDFESQADGHLMKASDTQFDAFWRYRYMGIYRANCAIEGLLAQEAAFPDKTQWKQYLGEVYFLRALFYNDMVEMWGDVPLITSSTQETNIPRTPAKEVYAQIALDLKNAIELMNPVSYDTYESGHATKWAAEAMMARVFLFYTGFYDEETLPLAAGTEGGTAGNITKSQVIDWVDDCIANSGHGLLGDYRNLWTYTNEFTVDDYEYTKDVKGVDGKPLLWAGNGNKETVFAIKFCNYSGWSADGQMGFANQFALFFGMRGGNGEPKTSFPFGMGWGQGPVAENLWNEWEQSEPGDIRMRASIVNAKEELPNYIWGADNQVEECGLWSKKLIPVLAYEAEAKGHVGNSAIFWTVYPDYDKCSSGWGPQGDHFQDLILIRFADVLLMQSELTGDADGINKVRARAGLNPIPGYSLELLQRERRHELCFEGRRWADIRRWGIAVEALKEKNGITVYNKGNAVVMRDGKYEARYNATNGFFPIPKTQVDLSNGQLKQNPGWDTPDANYSGWNFQ